MFVDQRKPEDEEVNVDDAKKLKTVETVTDDAGLAKAQVDSEAVVNGCSDAVVNGCHDGMETVESDIKVRACWWSVLLSCQLLVLLSLVCMAGYRGGSPTTIQAWRPCPLWEPSPSHPILV